MGANVREAQNAESKNDFIHKFKLAAKEIDATEYWLLLCKECYSFDEEKITGVLEKLKNINRIVAKIISTTKKGKTTENKE